MRQYKMQGTLQQIKVNKLVNYAENPRHAVGTNEKDTLEKLFNAVGIQYMLNLAKDIQQNGLLGNQQIVVVSAGSSGKYIVYEGNRRVAAIKLLLDPQKFTFLDKATKEKAMKIREDMEIEDTLLCYVTDENDAFFIMERTHSGEDRGRGPKEWGSKEKETFKARRKDERNMSYLIDVYVRKYCDGIDITSLLSFTTLQRIFNNREIKKMIGLDVANERTFTADKMRLVVEAAKWIAQEAKSANMAVTRLFNKARTIENKLIPWLEEYQIEHPEENDALEMKHDHEDIEKQEQKNEIEFSEPDTEENHDAGTLALASGVSGLKKDHLDQGQKSASVKDALDSLGGDENLPYFFQGIDYSELDPNDADSHGVAAVCRELQLFSSEKLVSTYPLASAFLVRAIIEQSIKYYSKRHKIQGQDKFIWDNISSNAQLSKIIKEYNRNLANYITNAEMRQYFTNLFANYETHVDPLNWVIHRPAEYQLEPETLINLPRRGLLSLINFMLS